MDWRNSLYSWNFNNRRAFYWRINYKKQDLKYNRRWHPDTYGEFADYHCISAIICWIVGVLLALIGFCFFATNCSTIVKNRAAEVPTYEALQAEYITLFDALSNSKDVINQDVYLAINDYNARASKSIAYSHQPQYSYNFTGKVDWDQLSIISIPETLRES